MKSIFRTIMAAVNNAIEMTPQGGFFLQRRLADIIEKHYGEVCDENMSVDETIFKEILKDDLYHVRHKIGFRGVVVSLKQEKVLCGGSKWLKRLYFDTMQDFAESISVVDGDEYQIAIEGSTIYLFSYENKLFMASNGDCEQVCNILKNPRSTKTNWDYSYIKGSTGNNLHDYASSILFPSFFEKSEEEWIQQYDLHSGHWLSLMIRASPMVMYSHSTSEDPEKDPVWFIGRYTISPTLGKVVSCTRTVADSAFSTFYRTNNIHSLLHKYRTEHVNEDDTVSEDEIVLFRDGIAYGVVEFESTRNRRMICHGSEKENELIKKIFHVEPRYTNNIEKRVSQIFTMMGTKDRSCLHDLKYLTRSELLDNKPVVYEFMPSLIVELKRMFEKSNQGEPHWFLHIVPIGYLLYGSSFGNDDFSSEPESTVLEEAVDIFLNVYGYSRSTILQFSVRSPYMKDLASALLNYYWSANPCLKQKIIRCIAYNFYQRIVVCTIAHDKQDKYLSRKTSIMNNVENSKEPSRTSDDIRFMDYLRNGLHGLAPRAQKYRISKRVSEIPSWRIYSICKTFSN